MNDLRALNEVNRIIHEPARLMIVAILAVADQADFLYLLNETGLTRGNLSAHLSKLEEAGYVQIQKTFRGKVPQTLVNLTPAGLDAFNLYRSQMADLMKKMG
ncbi:MAG: transcriptional regulator [Anaerolineae bacterium]|nr:transcriptional regulator [Anaerolineae bacterium]